jgi:hypothetical protein
MDWNLITHFFLAFLVAYVAVNAFLKYRTGACLCDRVSGALDTREDSI